MAGFSLLHLPITQFGHVQTVASVKTNPQASTVIKNRGLRKFTLQKGKVRAYDFQENNTFSRKH